MEQKGTKGDNQKTDQNRYLSAKISRSSINPYPKLKLYYNSHVMLMSVLQEDKAWG